MASSNRIAKQARAYMAEHPGVKYTAARDIVLAEQGAAPPVDSGFVASIERYLAQDPELGFVAARQRVLLERAGAEVEGPTWFEALGISDIDSYDPRPMWRATTGTSNLAAPLGIPISEDGGVMPGVVSLDLGEVRVGGDGPHGVVQGMTGSGKTWLLQGLALSLATLYGPDELEFVVVDFKGCQSFAGLEGLPHTVHKFEDGDDDFIDKAQALFDRIVFERQRLFAGAGVESFLEYQQARTTRAELSPLTHVVVILDEYRQTASANLAVRQWIEHIAQTGRAVGVHLVLGTQSADEASTPVHQMAWAISLRAAATGTLSALGLAAAARLPIATGMALMNSRARQPEKLDRLRVFGPPHSPTKLLERLSRPEFAR